MFARSLVAAGLVMTIWTGCSSSNGSPKVAPPVETEPAPKSDTAAPVADPNAGRQDLVEAGYAYVKVAAAEGLEVDIDVHAIEGDYALLLVVPTSYDSDSALALMKREGSTWKGLLLGTGIDCDALLEHGAPEALCNML